MNDDSDMRDDFDCHSIDISGISNFLCTLAVSDVTQVDDTLSQFCGTRTGTPSIAQGRQDQDHFKEEFAIDADLYRMEIKKAIRMPKQDMSECVPEETLSHWEAEASLRTAFAGGNANDFVVPTVYRRAYSVNELAWLWTDDHSISPNSETRDLAWEEILDAARIILSILLVALLTLGTPSSALVSTCIAKWTSMTWTICAIPRRTTKRPTASSVRVERVTKAIIQQSSSTPGRTPVGLLVRAQPITPYSYAGAEED